MDASILFTRAERKEPTDVTHSASDLVLGIAVLALAWGPVPLKAADSPLRYIAFGDSLTEGVGDTGESEDKGWPFRLEDLLQEAGYDLEVLNRGLGGENTPEGLTRIPGVLLEGGDLIFIMEGTNDVSKRISAETTRFNLKEMANKAKEKGFEVVLATVIPRYPDAEVDADNIANKRMNELIRDLAGQTKRDLVDTFEIFGQAPDRFRQLYAKLSKDPVGHLNPQGYDLMAQSFFDVLMGVDTVPPVPGVIVPTDKARQVKGIPTITVDLWDFGEGINREALFLLVNGSVVEAEIDHAAARSSFTYTPTRNLRGVVTLGVRSEDLNEPVNTFDREISTFAIKGTVFLDGDIDLDGRVDGYDLVILAIAFGSKVGQVRYYARADLNGDGFVDGFDLAILASNFGMSS
jgi:lysophospholipase L1-like esterase